MTQEASGDGAQPKPLLRTLDERYYEVCDDGYHTIHVDTPHGALDFCGIKHDNDPESETTARVKRELGAFVAKDSERPKVVVIEGWRDRGLIDDSEDDIVRQRGEAGLAEQMAQQAGIEIATVEPELHELFATLSETHAPDEVFYWLVAQQASQWGREDTVPDDGSKQAERHQRVTDTHLAEFVDRLEGSLGHEPSFNEISHSFEILSETHERLFGGELDWNDTEHFDAVANPVETGSVINDIMRESVVLRDRAIVAGLKKYLDKGYDVFAVYGDAHAYTTEPALRAMQTTQAI
jgi:hypothetical protein